MTLSTMTETSPKVPGPATLVCPCCQGFDWCHQFARQGYDFVRCKSCSLIRLDPQPTLEQLSAHYTARAKQGNYELSKAGERTATLDGVFKYVSKTTGLRVGKVFDVGCFDGGFLDIASQSGWESWGLEYQGPAAEVAKAKHPGRIFEGTLEAFEGSVAGDFDLCTGIGVIEHLLQPESLMLFADRILKPGGFLLLQTPNAASIPARVMHSLWPCYAAPEHTFYFSPSNVKLLGSRFGLSVVDFKSHFKPLRIGYAVEQFKNFGPEIYNVVNPVTKVLPPALLDLQLHLYGGEMLLLLQKSRI